MDSINQFVQSPLFSKFATPAGGILLILCFWWRAGSIHSILDRIWRLIAGRTDVEDPALKSFFQRNRELEKFRFVYRLNAQSVEQVKNLDRWLQEKSVDISQLQRVRRWVDLGESELVSMPPKSYLWTKSIILVFSMFLFWVLNVLNPGHIAYLQMRESGIWFRTDLREFRAPFGGWEFLTKDCQTSQSEIAAKTGFLKDEVATICSGIDDGSLKKFVDESLKTQTWLAVFLAALFMSMGIYNVLSIKTAVDARDFILRLRKKDSIPLGRQDCAQGGSGAE